MWLSPLVIQSCLYIKIYGVLTGMDQFDGIFEMYPTSIKKLYVVDGGLSFNSPFPLLLRPQRFVDLILSFDFSARPTDTSPPFKVRSAINALRHTFIIYFILAHGKRISEILPWDRKSYLTYAILPRLSREGYIALVVLELTHIVIK